MIAETYPGKLGRGIFVIFYPFILIPLYLIVLNPSFDIKFLIPFHSTTATQGLLFTVAIRW